ncbi:MAG TPA: hypothetical protein ENN30_02770 [Candidatus Woesearchaeota archaeon]|nr:hypothetical protein [Candidatus Woesearchaeota archaeon]
MRNVLIAIGVILLVGVIGAYLFSPFGSVAETREEVRTFASEAEFKLYMQDSYSTVGFYGSGLPVQIMVSDMESLPRIAGSVEAPKASRVSETNVQVLGIDEPDIVKTDGKYLYISPTSYWRYWDYSQGDTLIVNAFPPEDLELESKIKEHGDLLLKDDTLVIFSDDIVFGYDISYSKKARETWDLDIEGRIIAARMYDDVIYMVTEDYIDRYNPCPVIPVRSSGVDYVIECNDIYRPNYPVRVDITYTVMQIRPESGEILNSVSFVGSSGSSVVYMSESSIYITYPQDASEFDVLYGLMKESNLFPGYIIDKIEEVNRYDLSPMAKIVELEYTLETYMNSLGEDDSTKFMNDLNDATEKYMDKHMREFDRTGIVKIDLSLNVEATGTVPGEPLNQFALDEYKGNLRIATTVRGYSWSDTENDVYVLGRNLKLLGSVQSMGIYERIYAVRFLGDMGYLVTFRETDPFYVLDISNPKRPEVVGELKIPGYSAYLHPIENDLILGIGKDGRDVKISLFDVSNPKNPKEVDKYTLSDYWSDVLSTHHAFLLDKEHGIFFLPGSNDGYIFSYGGNELNMVKAVSNIEARRAVYMDDYLYIIGNDKIVVLDENTWERVESLRLN